MGWGSWRRKHRGGSVGPASAPTPSGVAEERLPDAEVLAVVAERLTELGGKPWRVEGGWAKGPGSTAVVLGEEHTGTAGHLDLLFVLNTDRPETTTVVDCVVGYGTTVRDKIHRAVETWATTTAVTLLELLEHKGRLADHLPSHAGDGFPGWHAIHGGIIGWGTGEGHGAVQDWAAGHPLLPALAPALAAEGFERDHLIGLKLFFGSHNGKDTAEVRVNGQVSGTASQALLGLDWPRRDTGGAYARTFVLLVHADEPTAAPTTPGKP